MGTLHSSLFKAESMVKPFFKDEYATLELDDSIPCVKLTLAGIPRYSEHYQFVQQKRLELIQQEIGNYPKLHMLTDSRMAGPVLDEDINYFKTHVMPEMEKIGIRYLAVVMPSSKFTRLSIKEMEEGAAVMKVRNFESIREARSWLKKMTNL
ncbi:MAG TPA: hypothetical protein VFZ52_08225 [Chryseolinea sp.]